MTMWDSCGEMEMEKKEKSGMKLLALERKEKNKRVIDMEIYKGLCGKETNFSNSFKLGFLKSIGVRKKTLSLLLFVFVSLH